MAVQKTHGLWCADRALKVKMAEFEKVFGPKPRSRQVPPTRMAANESLMVTAGYQRTRSFAEVVRGRGIQTAAIRTIHAVRLGGERDMVLTFTSVEDMKVKFQEMQEWLNAWCESAHVWQHGLIWGVVDAIDDDTLRLNSLHCGKDQCVCQSNKWKNGVGSSSEASAEAQITDESSRYEEEDDDVEVQMDKKSDLWGDVEVQLGKKSDSWGDVAGVGLLFHLFLQMHWMGMID
ncbi:hypothetical protein CsSME_00037487 [Camellia sinensis var. sinensis]